MPKLPPVSGKKAIKVFEKIDYRVVRKRGSHFRLKHLNKDPLSIQTTKL
ncbi:MAG: type II toxin-antitoxin system HicA family toxin [Patescibacteria group bacterium]